MDRKQINMNKISEAEKDQDDTSPKNKQRYRGKKRKRVASDSSTDIEDILPENTLEIEKNLHASAVKNNLDDASVKKILKKVVTNDHVLALVKLREEEEDSSTEEGKHVPKLTRSKVKELKKVSTGNTAWNLENLELTPIKHIPVKTRPEVKALIAQELPEDEDDDEYEPEDVPSDDDQTFESCSDLDSLPRTPVTPKLTRSSPKIVKDGPFIVPQELTPAVKRKLELDKEEATIALRTRSKLSLSETPIEHIESSFVPPDELPVPVDDLWNEFLVECLNPASTSKHEDDDETDPEYNVAADPDAPDDEDEEALEKSIVKISKKELNDLMTELFSIMPEVSVPVGEAGAQDIAGNTPAQTPTEVSGYWEGKQEPLSDDEKTPKRRLSEGIILERRNSNTKFSIGKNEPEDKSVDQENREQTEATEETATTTIPSTAVVENVAVAGQAILIRPLNMVNIALEEQVVYVEPPPLREPVPPSLLYQINTKMKQEQQLTRCVELHISEGPCILPEQILILQQQLRQHIQLATSNFLQLFVHPIHWTLAPTFKEFLETLSKLSKSRPDSVVKVCNLQPAVELMHSWEKSLSRNTPENAEYVQFVQRDVDKGRRCNLNNNCYVGNFHNTYMDVVANSPVFLYPHLLPPLPYRADGVRRQSYVPPEDELIAIGLDQFWSYVEKNPKLFPPPVKPHPRYRWGLNMTVELVAKYMFPFLKWKTLHTHIQHVRRKDKENPISIFLTSRVIKPIKHEILPFDPKKTLYDHPEHQIPYIWLKHLSKTSKLKRFRNQMTRRSGVLGQAPSGVPLQVAVAETKKPPLHSDFTKKIVCNRASKKTQPESTKTTEPTVLPPVIAGNLFTLQQTSTGPCLVPLTVARTLNSATEDTIKTVDTIQMADTTNTVNCTQTPISSTKTSQTPFLTIQPIAQRNNIEIVHCKCCVILQRIRKKYPRQSQITDYFHKKVKRKKFCYCNEIQFPRITNRLRLLVAMHKDPWVYGMETLKSRLMKAEKEAKLDVLIKERHKIKREAPMKEETPLSLNDLVFVIIFRSKVAARCTGNILKKINSLFVNFDLDSGDPAYLAEALYYTCKDDQIGLFHDFMGFLTAEQAARCGKFTDYFIQTCLVDLVKTIEDQIKENERREATLRQLNKVITYGTPTACDICMAVLPTLNKYPELALHVFSLFPHRTTKDNDRNVNNIISVKTTNNDDQQIALKENEVQVSACESCSSEQNETQVEERQEVQVENKAQAIKQTKPQVEKQNKVLKQTIQEVKKQDNLEIEQDSEEETEENGEEIEEQNEVGNVNKVQTRKQYKAQVEKQKKVIKLTRAQVRKLNKAQIEEQNDDEEKEDQNKEQMKWQNEKNTENKFKSPDKKRTKLQVEKLQMLKQTRVQQRKQKEAPTKVHNEKKQEEHNKIMLEEQKGEEMDVQEEVQMALQNIEQIKQQNEEEIKQQNEEQVRQHNEERMELQNVEEMEQQDEENLDQHNIKQVVQQNDNEGPMTMQSKQKKKVENEKQMEIQNGKRMELENAEKIVLQNKKQIELQNEKQMELDNEKQMEMQNEKHMELDNEKQIELDNEKEIELHNEKQMELENGDQIEFENENQVEFKNEKQTELQNERQMELQNEKQIELQSEIQIGLQNKNEMVLNNEKQMESNNEKQIELNNQQINVLNEKQAELQNEQQMEMQNKNQIELQNDQRMEMQNENPNESQNEQQLEMQNKNQIELQNEKQMDKQNEIQIGLQKENKAEPQKGTQQQSEEQVKKLQKDQINVEGTQLLERIEEAVNDASQTAVDYEADHSSSGEDENDAESVHERDNKGTEMVSKENESVPSAITQLDTHTITTIKIENEDYSEDSDDSMVIASDEETIISECPVWSRDEDKIILESLKDHLTPEERIDKTILEILEEECVFETLADILLHKSVKDIRDRVVYLLKMLLLSKK